MPKNDRNSGDGKSGLLSSGLRNACEVSVRPQK